VIDYDKKKRILLLVDFFYMLLVISKVFYYLVLIAENFFIKLLRGDRVVNVVFWFPSFLVTGGPSLVVFFELLVKL
jgi:hypothetical protein